MQEYFENREIIKYEQFQKETSNLIENRILANERIDEKWKSNNYKINNCTFAKMGFFKSVFSNDDLRFNIFIDCYFKKAIFTTVNFGTCVFINCNFDEATFVDCQFNYCRFDGCFIKFSALQKSLPQWPNLRWELCKNLSLECLKLGCESEFRKFYFEEKKASEQYFWKKFWHKGNDPYYKKYNWIDQISGLGNFILSKWNKMLWGYGEKLSRLILNIILVIIGYTILYYVTIKTVSETINMSLGMAIYMSLSNFFTVTCDYLPSTLSYRILSVSEGGVGIILMGFFVAALFRYVSRRG